MSVRQNSASPAHRRTFAPQSLRPAEILCRSLSALPKFCAAAPPLRWNSHRRFAPPEYCAPMFITVTPMDLQEQIQLSSLRNRKLIHVRNLKTVFIDIHNQNSGIRKMNH